MRRLVQELARGEQNLLGKLFSLFCLTAFTTAGMFVVG
jgi:hypothetical protein